jgi:hypothetical protein
MAFECDVCGDDIDADDDYLACAGCGGSACEDCHDGDECELCTEGEFA